MITKKILSVSISLIFLVSLAQTKADEIYKNPDIKFDSQHNKTPIIHLKKNNWNSVYSYKIQEQPEGERQIASKKEKNKKNIPDRNPSSNEKNKKEIKTSPNNETPRYWKLGEDDLEKEQK